MILIYTIQLYMILVHNLGDLPSSLGKIWSLQDDSDKEEDVEEEEEKKASRSPSPDEAEEEMSEEEKQAQLVRTNCVVGSLT